MRKKQRGLFPGFTLIELMITVSIIAILASIAIPKFADMVRKSQEAATIGSLGTMRSALSIYYSAMDGQYPVGINGVDYLTVNAEYLAAFPTLRLPYYHAEKSQPGAIISAPGCLLPCNPIQTEISLGEGTYPIYYLETAQDVGNPALNDQTLLGKIWILCSHTDSKGTVWSTY